MFHYNTSHAKFDVKQCEIFIKPTKNIILKILRNNNNKKIINYYEHEEKSLKNKN